jgi:7,8-dihydro-6-hydroxymethylpterin-pyrophosphokinase
VVPELASSADGFIPAPVALPVAKIERAMEETNDCKGPREIDLDILLFGDAVVKAAELEVPSAFSGAAIGPEPLAELCQRKLWGGGRFGTLAGVADQVVRRI